ncbi:MAG: hypothetical protein ACFE75_03795 [Candidatus Hodarchaeota archaeon]
MWNGIKQFFSFKNIIISLF